MDLKKFLPGLEEKKTEEYFWALAIEPGWVEAAIWKIENGKAEVVYTSPPGAWQSDEALLDATDAALSNAIQDFPEDFKEPGKTVFGVSYSWVSDGEIAKEYLEKIKNICKTLSLTPVGFVVLPEAISHFVKNEEGAPLNGLIIGVYKETLEISLFELGKLSGTTEVARSVSVAEDAVEGLTRLSTGKVFPSRILIYDGRDGELEEAKQSLISANWNDYENLKFLHTPKIELIDAKRKIYAVAMAGASEMGAVANINATGDMKKEPQEGEAKDSEFEENISPEELGFVLDKDINEPELAAQEIANSEKEELLTEEAEINESGHDNIMPVAEEELYPKESKKLPAIDVRSGLLKTFAWTKKINFRLPSFSGTQKPLLLGIIFFLLIIVLGGVWWWFYPTAIVTVYVSPQKLEEKTTLTVVANGVTSVTDRKLAGTKLETTVSGDRTTDTTGTKTVGEKAKGDITVYRVGTSLNLAGGTVVYGPQSLKYVLDDSVTIASGSASSPSETTVSVIAEAIGAQYNLAGGSTFTIGNYSSSDMEGKNSEAMSGGSSREISAVAKEDLDSLKDELLNELKEKAISELGQDISTDKYFIKESAGTKITEESFSHKVGDEAETLKLNLTVDATGVVVSKNELADLSKEILKEKIPAGFTLRGEQISYNFESKTDGEDSYEFDTRISANLLPEVKTDELAEKIAGKYPDVAQEYLGRDAPGFVRAEIKMKYALPGKLKTLPHVPKNIEVEVAAER